MSMVYRILLVGLIAVLASCGGGGGSDSGDGGGGNDTGGSDTNNQSLADTTPNAFSFAALTDVERSTLMESDSVVISGIDAAASVSIRGGEYSISGGAFTSAEETITNNQSIVVRQTSSPEYDTTTNAELTIGGVSSAFSITTFGMPDDTDQPSANVTFPPHRSTTTFGAVRVRGTAFDATTSVVNVDVAGVTAQSEDGFATWWADVPLERGMNVLSLSAGDEAGNTYSIADEVQIDYTEALLSGMRDGALDATNNRVFVVGWRKELLQVDLTSGEVAIISDESSPGDATFSSPYHVVYDSANGRALVFDQEIIAVDLITGEKSLLSSGETPDEGKTFHTVVSDFAIDSTNGRALVLNDHPLREQVISVDLVTGERTIVSESDSNSSSSSNPFNTPLKITVTDSGNSIYVLDKYFESGATEVFNVLHVDPANGDRTVVGDVAPDEPLAPDYYLADAVADNASHRLLLLFKTTNSDLDPNKLISFDLDSQQSSRLYFSSALIPELPDTPVNAMQLDEATNHLFLVSGEENVVLRADLATNELGVAAHTGAPEYRNPIDSPTSLVFDQANDRILLLDRFPDTVYQIDPDTGHREALWDGDLIDGSGVTKVHMTLNEEGDSLYILDSAAALVHELDLAASEVLPIYGPDYRINKGRGIAIDEDNDRLLLTHTYTDNLVFSINLTTLQGSVLSDESTPTDENPIGNPGGIAIDRANGRALIASGDLVGVDLDTGAATIIADAPTPLSYLMQIAVDNEDEQAFVVDASWSSLARVDLKTGESTLIIDYEDLDHGMAFPIYGLVGEMVYDHARKLIYVSNNTTGSVYAVDPTDGQAVILSR